MIVLETERTRIRRVSWQDLPAIRRLVGHPEVMRYSLTGPLSEAGADVWMNRALQRYRLHNGLGLWGIELRETGALAGIVGLIPQNVDGVEELEIGYRLMPDYWGRGLASETALGCRDYAFDVLERDDVISIIEPANTASIAVAKRVGMRLDRSMVWKGVAVEIYRIDRPDRLRPAQGGDPADPAQDAD